MSLSFRGSLANLQNLHGLSGLAPSLTALVNALPAIAKCAAIGLILLNVRSWPLMWHLRVFRPVFALRLRWYLVRLRTVFKSQAAKDKIYQKWFEDLTPMGKNPFETVTSYKSWTTTHYHFLREIPMLHRYEVRERIVGWDNKWVGMLTYYSPPASLRTPADGLQTPATPANPVIAQANESDFDAATAAMNAIAAAQLNTDEPDGATLNCVVISQLCFKHGRITVPPSIVLAASGFSVPAPEGLEPYSHANHPPHFVHAKELMSWASSRKYIDLMRGGWRDVPEGDRWWVDALGGVVEERRKTSVEGLNGDGLANGPMGLLRRGMDGARTV
ncbi:hypothetical protein FIBSPDRAFT_916417 [Athelia psychrophila]|uniref:Uncharacterized protein n=1 Tax=Athelia psychrophila TaxID=1759441 RepID=A0A166VGW5_9AGAM|nr:hypothetical protein FIBSPDRAFT_916417 [Fibularhizoctonia sp. CBS 109695]